MRFPDLPVFGGWVQAPAQGGSSVVVGLIYDISIEDDELARQLAMADNPSPEQQADQQFNRPISIEIRALTVGYQAPAGYVQALPPQPPLTMAAITAMAPAAIRSFTQRLDFLRLALLTDEIPADQVVVAALRQAAHARPEAERRTFLLDVGQACARLLGGEMLRLEGLLHELQQT